MPQPYVVSVKPSARRASAAAGAWVHDEGPTREFPDRAAADEWAMECSSDGAIVYVRDANPGDEAADGYLMALRRRPDGDAGNSDGREDEPGDQSALLEFRESEEFQASVQFFDER